MRAELLETEYLSVCIISLNRFNKENANKKLTETNPEYISIAFLQCSLETHFQTWIGNRRRAILYIAYSYTEKQSRILNVLQELIGFFFALFKYDSTF